MCQKAGKAKPALRLLQRMELCGMPVGPVQLRQVFFACCARGMVADALALMSRHDPGTGRRLLGKDVLVRGCGQMPGGTDGEQGLVLLEGRAAAARAASPDCVQVVYPTRTPSPHPLLWPDAPASGYWGGAQPGSCDGAS